MSTNNMKIGRFTVTKLNDSALSDLSVKTKNSVDQYEEKDPLPQVTRENDKKALKPCVKEVPLVLPQKLEKSEVLNPQANFMQYNGLVATHQQFLIDYLAKDSKRQEMIQKLINEILELTDKNAKLEIENNELKEILYRTNGKIL
jgi:hypothetical protein